MLDRSNRVWLGEFSTVASWDTIDSTNNKMYMIEQLNGVALPRIVEITQGPHDLDRLAASLQSSLNGTGKMAGLGTYYVTRVGAGDSAASGVLARAYQVDLSKGGFRIPPDVDVQSSFDVPLVDPRFLSRIFSFPHRRLRRLRKVWLRRLEALPPDLHPHSGLWELQLVGAKRGAGHPGQGPGGRGIRRSDSLAHVRLRARLRGVRSLQSDCLESYSEGR